MRILVAIDQWFPDTHAGSARVAAAAARALAARGHELVVLAPRNGSVGDSREGGVTVRRVLARNVLPQTLTDPIETWRHARESSAEPFDVLLAHESTTAVGLTARDLRAPMAFMFHASAAREQRFARTQLAPGLRKLSSYALAPSLSLLERRAVKAADRLLVLSDFSRSLLQEDHEVADALVSKVPGVVDTDLFSPGDGKEEARRRLGLDPAEPLLVTVRRLEPRMGIDRLLRALPRLGTEARLAVVGTGSLDHELPALAQELGVTDRVRFTGRVTDDELLADWYRAADVFVLPTTAYEGFGMATAEALACGTPVVGTPVGATPELLAPIDPRLIAASATPHDLAAAIDLGLELAADPALGDRCRASAEERFAPHRAAAEWERALEEACR